jgi:hypothetical protein
MQRWKNGGGGGRRSRHNSLTIASPPQ